MSVRISTRTGRARVAAGTAVLLQLPEQVLGPLRSSVEQARGSFMVELASLPEPFNSIATDHYIGRISKTQGRPMLGEYVPWLMGESLHIPDDAVESVAVPWLLLYEHILTTDDVIDKPNGHATQIILSSLLLERALSHFRLGFAADAQFWPAFRKYYEETALAELHEVAVFHNPDRMFTPQENLAMGRKSAILKACGAALSIKAFGHGLSAAEEIAFDDLCTGVQLFDDLSDWEEDLEARNFTFPLHRACAWLADLREVPCEDLTPSRDEIYASLLLSGAAADTVSESNRFLVRANMVLVPNEKALVRKYINSLAARNDYMSRQIRQTLDEARPEAVTAIVEALREGRLSTLPRTKLWRQLRYSFTFLALAAS